MSATSDHFVSAVPLTAQHARDVFAARRDPRNTIDMTAEQFVAMIREYEQAGSAWAVVADGTTIAIGGVYVQRPRIGEAWLIPTPGVEQHPVAFCKIAKIALNQATECHDLHRLQMNCRADDERACQFAERLLGFTDEGLMAKYGSDGADYRRFARVTWPI